MFLKSSCIMYSMLLGGCARLSAGFPGNSLVDLPIVSHNLVFCRCDVQTPSEPQRLFIFRLPCTGRLGNAPSSFEPITQPDPLIVTNLPESLIWGLPKSSVCTMWLSSPSCGFTLLCEGGKRGEQHKRTLAHLSPGDILPI